MLESLPHTGRARYPCGASTSSPPIQMRTRLQRAESEGEGAFVIGIPRDQVGGGADLERADVGQAQCVGTASRGGRQRLACGHAQQRGAEPDDERHRPEP